MPDDSRELVKRAFFLARESGKEDWRHMTVAVLKNRLLQLSHGEFAEKTYGKTTFREFVASLDDILRLDFSTSPATVELIEALPATESQNKARERVRPDLWRAIIDFRSGRPYVWDIERGEAREALPGESSNILPTVNETDLATWRREFMERHRPGLDVDGEARFIRWEREHLASTFLPDSLRGLWNAELKERVEKRLQAWFAEHKLQPLNLVVTRTSESARERTGSSLECLRELVIECVRSMTWEELSELRLSPTALLRTRRRSPRDSS